MGSHWDIVTSNDASYRVLNLRFNPFGAAFPFERAQLAVCETPLEELRRFLLDAHTLVQFVGAPGRGKSTHLWALHRLLPDAPVVHIPSSGSPVSFPTAPVVFVDGAQRFHPRQLWPLFQRARSCVIASRRSHSLEARLAGRRPRTIKVNGLSLNGLREYAANRIEWARYRKGALPEVDEDVLERLFARYGGDMRSIERALYNWVEDWRAYESRAAG